MRRAAEQIVIPGFLEAEGAVDGQADIQGIFIFLAIVFPPANRAQSERVRRFQGLVSAARAAKTSLQQSFHAYIDGTKGPGVYPGPGRLTEEDAKQGVGFPRWTDANSFGRYNPTELKTITNSAVSTVEVGSTRYLKFFPVW